MLNAPPVHYPVGRAASLGWLLTALWLLAAVPGVWMLFEALAQVGSAQAAIVSVAFCSFLWLMAGLGLLGFWRRQVPRRLHWDGESWRLGVGETLPDAISALAPGTPAVRLDLQRCLLIRWQAPGSQARWLWADASVDPQHWHLLRCALYSKARGQGAEPAAAPTLRA